MKKIIQFKSRVWSLVKRKKFKVFKSHDTLFHIKIKFRHDINHFISSYPWKSCLEKYIRLLFQRKLEWLWKKLFEFSEVHDQSNNIFFQITKLVWTVYLVPNHKIKQNTPKGRKLPKMNSIFKYQTLHNKSYSLNSNWVRNSIFFADFFEKCIVIIGQKLYKSLSFFCLVEITLCYGILL